MKRLWCKGVSFVLQVLSRIKDAMYDVFSYFKLALKAWKKEMSYIWRGFTVVELWDDIKLTFGSLLASLITAKQSLKQKIALRKQRRMDDVTAHIWTNPFSWGRAYAFLIRGSCYA